MHYTCVQNEFLLPFLALCVFSFLSRIHIFCFSFVFLCNNRALFVDSLEILKERKRGVCLSVGLFSLRARCFPVISILVAFLSSSFSLIRVDIIPFDSVVSDLSRDLFYGSVGSSRIYLLVLCNTFFRSLSFHYNTTLTSSHIHTVDVREWVFGGAITATVGLVFGQSKSNFLDGTNVTYQEQKEVWSESSLYSPWQSMILLHLKV